MTKKFNQVLSDDDIEELYLRSDMYGGEIYFSSLVEEIEQAVVAKLVEQQEPAAWLHEETGDVISSELKGDAPEMLKGYNTPLYRCPCFSCKGKLEG